MKQIESASPMLDIAERTMLLRGSLALPDDLKVVTAEFEEGWNYVQSGDSHWLDKRIQKYGWRFIWIAEISRRSGVGQTSQAAVASALKLALRGISERYNAAKVEHIKLTQYPWFFLATVIIYTYQVQQSANLSLSDESKSLSIPPPAGAVICAGNQAVPAAS